MALLMREQEIRDETREETTVEVTTMAIKVLVRSLNLLRFPVMQLLSN